MRGSNVIKVRGLFLFDQVFEEADFFRLQQRARVTPLYDDVTAKHVATLTVLQFRCPSADVTKLQAHLITQKSIFVMTTCINSPFDI